MKNNFVYNFNRQIIFKARYLAKNTKSIQEYNQ